MNLLVWIWVFWQSLNGYNAWDYYKNLGGEFYFKEKEMSVTHEQLTRLESGARIPHYVADQDKSKSNGFFDFDLPKEILRDFYDLRGHVCIANTRKNTKVLSITCSVPGEGSSTIATNLGFLMAGGLKKSSKGLEKSGTSQKDEPENLSLYFTEDFRSIITNDSFQPYDEIVDGFSGQDQNFKNQFVKVKADSLKKVLLIDANLQNPALHRYFGLEKSPGLAEIVEKNDRWQEVTQTIKGSSLSIITSGTNEMSSAEVLASAKLREVIREMRQVYDYILFDSSPVLASVDAVSLASAVDGVILIVRAGQTRWEIAQSAKQRLLAAEANLLGVTLNRHRTRLPIGI